MDAPMSPLPTIAIRTLPTVRGKWGFPGTGEMGFPRHGGNGVSPVSPLPDPKADAPSRAVPTAGQAGLRRWRAIEHVRFSGAGLCPAELQRGTRVCPWVWEGANGENPISPVWSADSLAHEGHERADLGGEGAEFGG